MNKPADRSKLGHVELAAIDLTITALQAAGHTVGDVSKDDNPRQQMAEAVMDIHHPFTDLSERDREIVAQMKSLAAQLSTRTSLSELLNRRGQIVNGGT